ncbi:LacI family transcriptional regulator [Rhodoferax lacus]|uniref:LacI family transcriptional regulator n=1 Tax=Rhodoferax lacus TaxID=2184758 RepID=A0A3E1R7D4_9BURK|nr:LacI family DNA-binding transcriptional regulator [Rhodoferax lacus]RFO95264.1 LacI family transcriptional regulator [Rhodoferax lacus]
MAHPHLLKAVALQAGVSLATVDRVVHQRPGVRAHTLRRVQQAMAELERQSAQVGLQGRKFMLDVVLQAPMRFAHMVRDALEREMPLLHPAVLRARYHLSESVPVADLVGTLDRIAARGSHGVLLKAPNETSVVDAVARLQARGIPVVTLVTDLPHSKRLAYVGMDNQAAGQTAAYLLGQWLGPERPAGVLVSLSSTRFRGEGDREAAFAQALQQHYPLLHRVDASEGLGLHEATVKLVRQRLQAHPDVCAVYSIGGANAAILQAFAAQRRRCEVFIGHDLDADNLPLLKSGQLSAVLHHDLQHDLRMACLRVMRVHGAGDAQVLHSLSAVQVITPMNLPKS